jgi:DNA-binding CsgD family transcriptional regulator
MTAPPVQYATTADGYDIAYTAQGHGRPLVLMPANQNHIGHYWSSPVMRPAFQELAARFRLIQYDCRGQGLSSRGLHEAAKPEDWRLDLEAVVEREGLNRFVLFDQHSFGYVSSTYTLASPERVEALVLLNVAFSRHLPLAMDALARENWDFTLQVLGPMVLPWEEPERAREIVRDIWDRADLVKMREAFLPVDTSSLWAKIGVPSLVVASRARANVFGTPDDSRKIAALIPDARLVLFDDVGCGFYGAEPPRVPGLIEEFLAELEARPGAGSPVAPPRRLSPREVEVLRLVAEGKSNQQIAQELVISPATVAKHVTSILTKTESRNRAGAVSYAHHYAIV